MTYNVRTWIARLAPLGMVVAFFGCSDDGDASNNVDPRCAQLCVDRPPSVEGAYDVCSEKSAADCRLECAARLSGTAGVCSQCLLEDSYFGAREDGLGGNCRSPAAECGGGTECTVTGHAGSCTYCESNSQQREDCVRKVSPRRTVDCKARYQSVSKCTEYCK